MAGKKSAFYGDPEARYAGIEQITVARPIPNGARRSARDHPQTPYFSAVSAFSFGFIRVQSASFGLSIIYVVPKLARQFRASQSERLKKVSGMIIEVFGLRPPASAEVDHVPRQCRNCEDNAVARQLFHEVGAEQNRAACHRVSDRHSHLGARRDPCRVGRRQQPTTAGDFQTDRAFDAIHQIVAFKAECFRRAARIPDRSRMREGRLAACFAVRGSHR